MSMSTRVLLGIIASLLVLLIATNMPGADQPTSSPDIMSIR